MRDEIRIALGSGLENKSGLKRDESKKQNHNYIRC